MSYADLIEPGSFDQDNHYYTKVLNANIHPLVSFFFNLKSKRIINRYCHLNPMVNKERVTQLLKQAPKHFRWSGADLMYVTTQTGKRSMVLIETNSCPSGQKSMPLVNEHDDSGGYRNLIEKTLKPIIDPYLLKNKKLAVIYDKNLMEASGYAAIMADIFGQPVYLVKYYDKDPDPPVKWKDKYMYIRTKNGSWIEIGVAFRYVTQKPWNRFPITDSKTLVLNPVIACISGGRNKLVASKAYEFFNAQYGGDGLEINTPETIREVSKQEIPLWVSKFNGNAVIKVPYSNAGQGVYTITNDKELDNFMKNEEETYDQYIVQSLIGNFKWSSNTSKGQLYHVGTIPDKNGNIFVADIRMMIHYDYTNEEWRPLAIYSRRAEKPLVDHLDANSESWDILGTNLSQKKDEHEWTSDTNRLLIMDRRDFNRLGIGMDDLINAFIQTVQATLAIDDLSDKLISDGKFNKELFTSLNPDQKLIDEFVLEE